jgi:ankyrin repeat protein
VMKMILENDRLPNIVQEVLGRAENLRKLVQNAMWEIVEDIKAMLYNDKSMFSRPKICGVYSNLSLVARWLGSERMSQQSKHHSQLQNLRADQACEFLLTDAKFISWYRAFDSQQLVILGNMGCGKSVAMAFLVDELRQRNEHQLPQPKICYHYCQDGEAGKIIYIYSALILSLLEQFSGLKRTFFEWYKQAGASGNFEPATDIKKLEDFLQKLLITIDRPLFIVIDGLDECDRSSQNNLLRSLKILMQKTPRLKVILSSRPQEEILEQLDGIAKIDLGSDAERDGIIVEKTVERKLFYLSKDVRTLVTETLSRLAQGSAIWTKMVVELIEVRRIRALGPMQDFLDKMPLPEQLSELFVNLISRCTSNDPENRKLVTTALEVLATTRRPLSILELAWAVSLGGAQKRVTTVAALAKLVDHHRVMSLIQPFVAHVDFDDVKKHQIRLAHQSVKEFVVREWASNRPGLQGPAISTATDQGLINQRTGSLEAGILDICIRYLLLDDFGDTDLFSAEQLAIEELPQESDLFNNDEEPTDYDPYCTWEAWEENMIRYDPTERGFGELFVYASCHWLEHFGATTVEPLPSLENIENLCQARSTRLQNWIKQNCRPQCTIKPRFVFDSSLYDPLSITSLYGSEAMLRDMLESSDFDKDKFLGNPAMGAADQILQWGDMSRLRMLFLGSTIGHQLQNLGFFRLVMKQWSTSDKRHQDWDIVFDLIDDVLDILVKEQWGNELLCMAASMGCMPIIRRLMDRGQHKAELKTELLRWSPREPQSMTFGKHQSIGEAVLGNHVDVVEYLLGQQGIEAHLQYRNSRGENALHLASRLCNPAMFRLLVSRFKEGVQQTDDQKETALVRIIQRSSASRDQYESAQILLLEGGANWDDRSGDEQQDPLRIAARLGDLEMCRLLICIGKMNPLSALRRDNDGQTVLKEETSENEQNRLDILQLLRAHADAVSTPSPRH